MIKSDQKLEVSVLALLTHVGAGRDVRFVARRMALRRDHVRRLLAGARDAGLVREVRLRRGWTLTELGDLSLRTGIVQTGGAR